MLRGLASGAGDEACLIVGEIGQAHDGSLGTAHALVDVIADAGADAVKFQTHLAAAESTPGEPWRVKFSPQDATRYDYWKRMEFTEDQWRGLRQHAEARNLHFISSPFSFEAVDLLRRVGLAAWKVASGEVSNLELIKAMADDGRPILISSGMSSLEELDAAVRAARGGGSDVAVLQCTSSYPCPPERVGLNLIPNFRERFNCAAGLSDHSGTIYPALAAAALGLDVLEVHVTLSRQAFGPDVTSSLTPSELSQVVEGIRFIEAMLAEPVDKEALSGELAPVRSLFTKSVVVRQALAAGTILGRDHLTAKKPGTGIAANRIDEVIGRRLLRPVDADHILTEDDLEPIR